jgi:hypothetical protein
MVEADVCFSCFGNAESDLHLAMTVLKKRAELRDVPVPLDGVALLAQLCKREV